MNPCPCHDWTALTSPLYSQASSGSRDIEPANDNI